MSHDFNKGNRPGAVLTNLDALLPAAQRLVLGPRRGERGFPQYAQMPRLLIDKKLGRRVRDLEECYEYWLVSGAMKAVLESADPASVAFNACETVLPDGTPGPKHWLCDVVPMLDAVDEATSIVRILDAAGAGRRYDFLSNTALAFRPDIVAQHHIFRLTYRWPAVICDDVIRRACKAAKLDGIYFRNAANISETA
jgi:hypothetical protein